jgi:hypothetical protein
VARGMEEQKGRARQGGLPDDEEEEEEMTLQRMRQRLRDSLRKSGAVDALTVRGRDCSMYRIAHHTIAINLSLAVRIIRACVCQKASDMGEETPNSLPGFSSRPARESCRPCL